MNLAAIRPVLDPLAHRAAIQALEAQRSAYARYAQRIDGHRSALAEGSGDRAAEAAAEASAGHDALTEGAQRLAPLLNAVQEQGSDDQRLEVQRQVEDMMRAARTAETAIQNLTSQLEAWRDAYVRQLSAEGVVAGTPDGEPGAGTSGVQAGASHPAGAAYGPRGQQARTISPPPSLLDRKG